MNCEIQFDCEKSEVDVIQVDLCFCDLLKYPDESIVTVYWQYTEGIDIVRQLLPVVGDTVSALVGGGTAGNAYLVRAIAETNTGQIDACQARIGVIECPKV